MFLEPSWGQDWLSWSPRAHQPHGNEKQTERMSMCSLGLWHRDMRTLHSYFTIGSTGCCVVTTPATCISPSWTLKTLFILCSELRSFESEKWGSICSSGNKMTCAPLLHRASTEFFCVHLQVTECSGQWLLRQKEDLSYKPFCQGKFCSEKLTYAWLQHWSHVSVTAWLTLHLAQHVELTQAPQNSESIPLATEEEEQVLKAGAT